MDSGIYLERAQIEDLLSYCGSDNIKSREAKDDIMCCCPVHGEHHPSCGISVSKQIFHCFSCGASGDFVWLLHLSLPDEFKNMYSARDFILNRYHIKIQKTLGRVLKLKDYDDLGVKKQRNTLPTYKLAPFQSGKATFQYIFDRGITKSTAKRFMLGQDIRLKTVTIPVFWDTSELAGVIGRFIDPDTPYANRYHLYEGFERKNIIFPWDKLDTAGNVGIMVEGILDAVYMHQLGFTNTFSILGNQMTYEQSLIIPELFDTIIDMTDADSGGDKATEIARKRLKRKIDVYKEVEYPDGKNDPFECSYLEIKKMIRNAHSLKFLSRGI